MNCRRIVAIAACAFLVLVVVLFASNAPSSSLLSEVNVTLRIIEQIQFIFHNHNSRYRKSSPTLHLRSHSVVDRALNSAGSVKGVVLSGGSDAMVYELCRLLLKNDYEVMILERTLPHKDMVQLRKDFPRGNVELMEASSSAIDTLKRRVRGEKLYSLGLIHMYAIDGESEQQDWKSSSDSTDVNSIRCVSAQHLKALSSTFRWAVFVSYVANSEAIMPFAADPQVTRRSRSHRARFKGKQSTCDCCGLTASKDSFTCAVVSLGYLYGDTNDPLISQIVSSAMKNQPIELENPSNMFHSTSTVDGSRHVMRGVQLVERRIKDGADEAMNRHRRLRLRSSSDPSVSVAMLAGYIRLLLGSSSPVRLTSGNVVGFDTWFSTLRLAHAGNMSSSGGSSRPDHLRTSVPAAARSLIMSATGLAAQLLNESAAYLDDRLRAECSSLPPDAPRAGQDPGLVSGGGGSKVRRRFGAGSIDDDLVDSDSDSQIQVNSSCTVRLYAVARSEPVDSGGPYVNSLRAVQCGLRGLYAADPDLNRAASLSMRLLTRRQGRVAGRAGTGQADLVLGCGGREVVAKKNVLGRWFTSLKDPGLLNTTVWTVRTDPSTDAIALTFTVRQRSATGRVKPPEVWAMRPPGSEGGTISVERWNREYEWHLSPICCSDGSLPWIASDPWIEFHKHPSPPYTFRAPLDPWQERGRGAATERPNCARLRLAALEVTRKLDIVIASNLASGVASTTGSAATNPMDAGGPGSELNDQAWKAGVELHRRIVSMLATSADVGARVVANATVQRVSDVAAKAATWARWSLTEWPACEVDCHHPLQCIDTGWCRCVIPDNCPPAAYVPSLDAGENATRGGADTQPVRTDDAPRPADSSAAVEEAPETDTEADPVTIEDVMLPRGRKMGRVWPRVHVLQLPAHLLPPSSDNFCYHLHNRHCFSADNVIYQAVANLSVPLSDAELFIVPFYQGCEEFTTGKPAEALVRVWRHVIEVTGDVAGVRTVWVLTHDWGACGVFKWNMQDMLRDGVLTQMQQISNSIVVQHHGEFSTGCYKPHKDVVIPARTCNSPKLRTLFGSPSNIRPVSNRSHLAFFAGSLWPRATGNALRHRLVCKGLWQNSSRVVVGEWMESARYMEMLNTSVFCLAPRGVAGWSYRIADFIYAGCIPVLISDGTQNPFSELLDYSRFSVTVPETALESIYALLTSFSPAQLRRLQAGVLAVRSAFMYAADGDEMSELDHPGPIDMTLRTLTLRLATIFPR